MSNMWLHWYGRAESDNRYITYFNYEYNCVPNCNTRSLWDVDITNEDCNGRELFRKLNSDTFTSFIPCCVQCLARSGKITLSR